MMEKPLEPRDYQTRIINQAEEFLRKNNSLLVTAPTGSGKCHPMGTMILMYDGNTKSVESIVSGDQLMGPDSRPRKVQSTSTGYGPIVEIIPVKGKPWRCNDEHILTLIHTGKLDIPEMGRRNQNEAIVDIPVKRYRNKSSHFKHNHKLFHSGEIRFDQPAGDRDLPTSPYILGALLGNGDPTDGRTLVTSKNPAAAPAMEEYTRQMMDHGSALGISELRAEERFIPQGYKTASPQDRLEALAGLMDAGGSLDGAIYNYISKSRQLAKDVCFLAHSLGMAAHLQRRNQSQGTCWHVSISGETPRIPCRISCKQAPPWPHEQEVLSNDFSIADAGRDWYYGFTLDGDGRYLLDDFTVTHNTVCMAEICAMAMRKNRRVGILVHRQELVTQSEEKIARQCSQAPGVVWQNRREWDEPVTIMAQDTISGLEIPTWLELDLLMIDEAHHAVAPGWLRTVKRLGPSYLLGFSATPFRQDKEPLSPKPFAEVIRPVTPMELIERKLLCPAMIESPVIYDRKGNPQPINQARNPEAIYHQAVRYAVSQGRARILLYASQTGESSPVQVVQKTVRRLREAGINAGGIYQDLSTRQRKAALARFKSSASASVLVNYMALTEGTDLPHVDCVIIGRHTESESTIIQMIGRGLRTHEQKNDCLVLDYTGRPDMSDIIHYWRLDNPEEEKEKAKRERAKNNTPAELEELATRFPRQISLLEDIQVQYPWFRPYAQKPVMALSLWNREEEAGRYITVEPLRKGGWRVSTITLLNRGATPLRREQSTLETPEEAAVRVRMALGGTAPLLKRDAPWRQKPASPAQRDAWRRLYPKDPQDPGSLTAGETWDSISQERFRRRVNPDLL